jgi:hypothetical protein
MTDESEVPGGPAAAALPRPFERDRALRDPWKTRRPYGHAFAYNVIIPSGGPGRIRA